MTRFIIRLLINAVALWLTTLIVTGVTVVSFRPRDSVATVFTYLLIALIFGIVNGVLGTIIRVVAFPLYILTLGLISLVVNGLLLLIVGEISSLLGFGLVIEGFGWGIIGALVLGVLSWLIGLLIRPIVRQQR